MTQTPTETSTPSVAPPRAEFRLRHLGVWVPLCVVHGAALAWLAYGLQKHFAPLGLFPLLVGFALGVTLAGLMRLVQVAGTGTILLGVTVAAGTAVFGQHYFSYLEQRETAIRQAAQFRMAVQVHPDLVQGTPPAPASGVFEYLRWQAIRGRPMWGTTVARHGWAWASWAVDACLTFAAALLVILPAVRRPYCNQCRTWFSTVRGGKVSGDKAGALASAIGEQAPDGAESAAYRFVHCRGGCGTAGFELCWEWANGRAEIKRVWISSEDRRELEKLIG